MRQLLSLSVVAVVLLFAEGARADIPTAPTPEAVAQSPFARKFSVAGYGMAWAGAYGAGGVGWRMRWDALDVMGVEVFGESLLVENQGGLRHDHPIGFDLVFHVRFSPDLQLRLLAGFCAVFSFIEPPSDGGPRSDDVLFGAHAGVGIEGKVTPWMSLFLDVQAIAYVGHSRYGQVWGSAVSDDLAGWGSVQAAAGTAFHFDI